MVIIRSIKIIHQGSNNKTIIMEVIRLNQALDIFTWGTDLTK